jgi:hypothetical protein
MSPNAPVLTPITKDEIIGEIAKAGINGDVIRALREEGFTDAMTLAFLNTANATKTIVSSRVPGKACTELIAQGHDLKGFQIKCKSCDWGPMAGFLCQLPFFNKAGYSKIGYNTGYIVEYLEGLDRFSGTKQRLKDLTSTAEKIKSDLLASMMPLGQPPLDAHGIYEALPILSTIAIIGYGRANKNLGNIFENLQQLKVEAYLAAAQAAATAAGKPLTPDQETTTVRSYVIDKAMHELNKSIGAEVASYKKTEEKAGSWSGENALPEPSKNALPYTSPFVQLKRRFTNAQGDAATPAEVATQLKALGGVTIANEVEKQPAKTPDRVTGLAYNKSMGTGLQQPDNGASIKMEFMLQRDANDSTLWLLYHRDIWYRLLPNVEWIKYENYGANNDDVLKEMGIDPGKYSSRIDYVNKIFSRIETDIALNPIKLAYYPLCGIMNPRPPYPTRTKEDKDNPDFYKNAVSGDYDLFAFWPAAALPDSANQLVRLSERKLGYTLKVAYPNPLFYLDFIPGFKEIDKNEDAEKGNMNNLGEQVANLLNSQFRALDIRLASTAATPQDERGTVTNKAFHSDEGGRPGILEIEFPIAVFFPKKIKTRTLGAVDANGETAGGLVTTITNFLQLLLDINYTIDGTKSIMPKVGQYKIILQSEWMMHLFYLAFPAAAKADLWTSKVLAELYKKDATGTEKIAVGQDLLDRQEAIGKRIKEFEKIEKEAAGYNQVAFANNLKTLLFGTNESGFKDEAMNTLFTNVQKAFLNFACEWDKKAYDKRIAIEKILYAISPRGLDDSGDIAPQ